MQTCPDCGVRNEDGELFCGACGTYLEWEEHGVEAASSSSSSTTAELTQAEPAPERVVEPAPQAVEQGAEPAPRPAAAQAAEPAPQAAVQEAGEPATEVRDTPEAPTAVESAPPTRATRARTAVDHPPTTGTPPPTAAATAETPAGVGPVKPSVKPVKPAAIKPAAAVPGPVQPAAARPRRHVPPAEKDEPPPAPGDLICGACGAGNAPHRNFCRRCGASLADAPTQGRGGWWRRWRDRRRARRDGPKAGTRPKRRRRRRFPTKTVVLLVVLALLGGGGYYFRDELGTGYHAVLDRVAGNDPVNPAEVTASSSASDRGPDLARDGISDRSWAPEATGDGAGEWLQFEFDEPFRLVTVLLTAGASTADETRLLEARPSRVRLTVTTADGAEQIHDVDVVDTGEPQPISLPTSDVVSVRMTILSAYGATDDVHVAVAEVEFRGR